MALSSGLADTVASKRNNTSSALGSTPMPGGNPLEAGYTSNNPTGSNDPQNMGLKSTTGGSPGSPDPYGQARAQANSYGSSFDLASALASISGAAQLGQMQQQSDYYGALAARMGQDPSSGYAQRSAGLQQALLGINQQQLGYDANTLHAQSDYINHLYGTAGKSFNDTNSYLDTLYKNAQAEYGSKVGNFSHWLHAIAGQIAAQSHGAQLAEQQQQAGYTSDAVARGAFGAAGTTSSIHNMVDQLRQNLASIKSTGAETSSRVTNERESYIAQYKHALATITNQRADAKTSYDRAGLETLQRAQEINNALSKNSLEVQADNLRKQQAAAQANQASSQAAWQNSMAAMQYQQQQSLVNGQMQGARAGQFYQALQLAPQIQQYGGAQLAQLGQDPGFQQMLQGLSGGQLNQMGLSSQQWQGLGFTPQQLAFMGVAPMPQGQSPYYGANHGGTRRY